MSDMELVPAADQPVEIANNPVVEYLSRLNSEGSRRVQASALYTIVLMFIDDDARVKASLDQKMAAILDFRWWALRKPHVTAIKARLLNDFTLSTVNRSLSALRGVLEACWELGYMSIEDYQRAASVKNVSGKMDMAGRDIPDREIRQLLVSCYEDGDKGVRDLAVLAIMATCGLRRAELAALKIEDFNPETGELKVFGKGRKVREVYVLNRTREKLDDWLAIRGDAPGPLFYSFRKGDRMNRGKPMGAQAIYFMLKERALAAGLPKTTPHDFRRTVTGKLLDAVKDAILVAKVLGHSRVETTMRYDRRDKRAKRKAQAQIDLPI